MRITNHESFSRYKPFNVQGYLSCNRFWRGLMDNRVPVKATLRAIKQLTFILFHAELQKDGTLYKHHRALSLHSSLNTELKARRSALLKDRIPFEWTSLKHKLKFKWKQLSKFQTRRIFTTKNNSCINNKWVLLLTDVVERMLVEKQSWVQVLRGNTSAGEQSLTQHLCSPLSECLSLKYSLVLPRFLSLALFAFFGSSTSWVSKGIPIVPPGDKSG